VSESNGLGSFDHVLYERLLRAVCERDAGVTGEVVGSVIDTYCGQYADVHYTTCKVLAKIAKETASSRADDDEEEEEEEEEEDEEEKGRRDGARGGTTGRSSGVYCMRTVYDILLNITDALAGFDDEALASWCGASEVGILVATNDGTKRQRKRLRQDGAAGGKDVVRGKWSSRKLRQRAVSDAWIEFLKSHVPADCYRSLLTRLHNTIIPALINPLLLSDFLTHALNRGGMDGMLALNGIFILVTQHGLEYPKFYQRLYGLLTGDVFLSKHRVRFFQLADIFLASPMVPAYTAAAFAKKFARLGIRGSPATAIIAIAFVHNIIRRHPSCVQILNRPESMRAGGGSAKVWRGMDVYDEQEEDPAESRALESSMWEISVFRNHSDCTVAQFARTMLEKDMTNKVKTAEVDISEVLGTSYASLFDKEIKRRMKSVPTTVYAGTRSGVPQRLFGAADDAGDGPDAPAPFPGFVLA
jgi:U3 small nucleolar RNA-associated protein 19